MKAWVVWGEEGEYSDRRVWTVRAFVDEGEARAFVEAVSAQAREVWMAWKAERDAGRYDYSQDDRARFPIPLDPVGGKGSSWSDRPDYDSCDPPQYHVDEVPLGPVEAP